MIHHVGKSCLNVVGGLLHCLDEFISPLRNKKIKLKKKKQTTKKDIITCAVKKSSREKMLP